MGTAGSSTGVYMRRIILCLVVLLAAAGPVAAQDLQYRVRMQPTLPDSMKSDMPTPEMTVSIKGKSVRMDNEMRTPTGIMKSTVIMDDATSTFYILLHGDSMYMQGPDPAADMARMRDSVAKRYPSGVGAAKVTRTGERSRIAGYNAERVIIVANMPNGVPGAPPKPLVAITDFWVATDPALAAAYRPFAERSARYGEAVPGADAMLSEVKEFPLRSTHLLIDAPPAGQEVDAIAILKQDKPAGMTMRMTMEVHDVKLGPLPASLFKPPANYKRTGQ
jgi:hypothetical protein